MVVPLTKGMGRPAGGYQRPLGWWYYAKKSLPLFPGIGRARSAEFLAPFYESIASRHSLLRKALHAIVFAGFQGWLPIRVRQVAKRFGMDKDWVRSAGAIASRAMADPNDIALFRIEEDADFRFYMRRYEHAAINRAINPQCWKPECVLANKIEFYARCREHGLPHPQVYATAIDGATRIHAVPQAGPVAVKPAGGEGGTGFRLANFVPEGAEPEQAFAAFLGSELDASGLWVVQEKLSVHPDLAEIALSAVVTARITTLRNETGAPEIVTSVLRFPSSPSSLVDNIKSGGLMAPIDPESGTLGRGCVGRGTGDDYLLHPANGALIEGRRLPDWENIKALVVDAHANVFPEYNLIGWDIAPTPAGPVIIEGNGKPCLIVAQRGPGKGLGQMRFGELIEMHLSNA